MFKGKHESRRVNYCTVIMAGNLHASLLAAAGGQTNTHHAVFQKWPDHPVLPLIVVHKNSGEGPIQLSLQASKCWKYRSASFKV